MKNKIKFKKESVISVIFFYLVVCPCKFIILQKNARNFTYSLGIQ